MPKERAGGEVFPVIPGRVAHQPERLAVKAALEKAATLGTPDVSAAAAAELKQLR